MCLACEQGFLNFARERGKGLASVRSARRNPNPRSLKVMTALWDYEKGLLSHYDTRKHGIPVGMERLAHESWVQHVKDDLPMSDFTWTQYVEHVEAGDGDAWFLERGPLVSRIPSLLRNEGR